MKTSLVSTLGISTAVRLSILKSQSALVSAQKEVATGRHADVGLTLGHRAGGAVSVRQEHARLNTIVDANKLTGSRLDATQAALGEIRETADDFLGALIAVRESTTGAQALQEQAARKLEGLIATLNSNMSGRNLFGGIASDVVPVSDYFAVPLAANKQTVDNAFLAAFGMTQDDPGLETIAAADMQVFLDGDFAALFEEPQWSAGWSQASSENMQTRISPTEVLETSVNANEQAVRKLAMAYTMVADLGAGELNEAAFRAVAETATRLVSEAIHGITAMQGRVGSAQGRIEQVNERMSLQLDIFSREITGLENVDPFEAATRVTTLMTQLETGYALTARIQRLSILNYL
jgi:flagellar hook-associated protein 3 FlgL